MADFSDPQDKFNPYAAPSATADLSAPQGPDDDEVLILAERGTRWWARFVDNMLLLLSCIPVIVVYFNRGVRADVPPGVFAATLVPMALVVYQWVLISTRGQTLGKKWTGIRIVRLDGSPVGFVYGVLLREWIMRFAGFIPYIGAFIGLIDALMIFGDERRCLHDQIAGTKVVVVLKLA